MSDLDDEARALFDAARAGYEPNEADRRRVLRGVLLRAGVAVGVTGAGAAAGAPLAAAAASSGITALAIKGALLLTIIGSAGVGGYAISRPRSRAVGDAATSAPAQAHSAANPDVSGRALLVPRAAELPSSAELAGPSGKFESSHANTPRSNPAAREANPRSPASATPASSGAAAAGASGSAAFPADTLAEPARSPAPSTSVSTLGVEARGLAQVQKDLKDGRNAEALRLVEEQRQLFAHGELQPERDAAKIVALCAVGRVADARAAARTFLASWPHSPFAARIRASCAGSE